MNGFHFENFNPQENGITQEPPMKWLAFAKVYIEGIDYYFSYFFEMPNELYWRFLKGVDTKQPITTFDCFKEVLSYAELAIHPSEICGYDDPPPIREEGFGEEFDDTLWDEDYSDIYCDYNLKREKVNAVIEYIRLFDPWAQKRLIDFCLDLPLEKEFEGKKRKFSYHLDGETFEWYIDYTRGDEWVVTRMKTYLDEKNTKYLNGVNSLYPPFDKILEELKKGEVSSSCED